MPSSLSRITNFCLTLFSYLLFFFINSLPLQASFCSKDCKTTPLNTCSSTIQQTTHEYLAPPAFYFTENKGQWATNIHYQVELANARIYFEKDRLTYNLINSEDLDRIHHYRHHPDAQQKDWTIRCHAFQAELLNANAQPDVSADVPRMAKQNYFIGNDPNQWASEVQSYERVTYGDIYDGVDLRFYNVHENIKYDFIVAPHADARQIQWKYEGVDELFIKDGKLSVVTSVNTITELQPYVYQNINHKRQKISCQFKLEGNIVSFELLDDYDKNHELIIDPELVFSSYTGSAADNWGFTATYDDEGHLYAGGVAFGVGYPTTLGAYQLDFAGGDTDLAGSYAPTDIAISKFSPDGSELIYSTYIGGATANEAPHSLIVNKAGELVIFGSTGSFDYPTTANAVDQHFLGGNAVFFINGIAYPNGSDIIVSKLSNDGSTLTASTYMGGSGNDGVNLSNQLKYNYGDEARGEVILDEEDNIYIATSTNSPDFPTTSDALVPNHQGEQDACFVKFNPDLSEILWSSYYGGVQDDAAYSIKVASDNSVYVCGGSNNLLLSTSFAGVDGYLLRLDLTQSGSNQLIGKRDLATNNYDQAYFVDFDPEDNVYVIGQSAGGYPIQGDVYVNANSGQFIHKFSPDLQTSLLSTVFGNGNSEPNISITAFLVDDCGRIYLSGWGGNVNPNENATTTGMPITAGSIQPSTDGSDFYFMVLTPDAESLSYGSYFGDFDPDSSGEHVDGGTSRFDKNGTIYQAICAGCGNSDDFPTTPGVWSNTNESQNCNLAGVKIALGGATSNFTAELGDCTDPLTVQLTNQSQNATAYIWDFGDNTGTSVENPIHTYETAGTYTITLLALQTSACITADTFRQTIMVMPSEMVTITPMDFCINAAPTPLMADVEGGIWSGNGVENSQTGLFNPSLAGIGSHEIVYEVTNNEGCIATDTAVINVFPLPDAGFSGLPSTFCSITDTTYVLIPNVEGGEFSGFGVVGNTFNPSLVPEELMGLPLSISYEVRVNGCASVTTLLIVSEMPPDASFGGLPTRLCDQANRLIVLNPTTPNGQFSGVGIMDNGFNPSLVPDSLLNTPLDITYTVRVDGCTNSSTQSITVYTLIDATFTTVDFCEGDEALALLANVVGGIWEGVGVDDNGVFNPTGLATGAYPITYTTNNNDCLNSFTDTIFVYELLDARFATLTFCSNEEPQSLMPTIAGGIWEGMGVDENGLFDPTNLIAGSYPITYTTSNNNCFNTFVDTIVVFPTMQIDVREPECVGVNTDLFTVDVILSSGRNQEGDLVTILGDSLMLMLPFSDTLTLTLSTLQSSYDLVAINEQTNCQTNFTINAPTNCINCAPNAGDMQPTDLQVLCAEDTAQAEVFNAFVDEGQVLAYVLHTHEDASLGTLLASNFTGIFTFPNHPEAQYQTEYYISAIIGFPDEQGFPLLNDECTAIAAGSPVLFLAPLNIVVDDFCDNTTGTYELTIQAEGGLPAFDPSVPYQLTGTILTNLAVGESVSFSFTGSETYALNVEDGFCLPFNFLRTFDCVKTPIELLAFSGEVLVEGNLLTWQTASETNNDFFTLERSINGHSFEVIAQINGQANATTTQHYSFLDKAVGECQTYYYRLRQTDFNGESVTFNTISLQRGEHHQESSELNIITMPNHQIMVQLEQVLTAHTQIFIYDVMGRLVTSPKIDGKSIDNCQQRLNVSTQELPTGVYLLQVVDGDWTSSRQFWKE